MLNVPAEEIAAIAFGSNLGDSGKIIEGAIAALGEVGTILKVSPWYRTAPIGPEQPDYLNGCLLLHSKGSSEDLMQAMLKIETQFGRTRSVRWGPRTLDLDLLFRGSRTLNTNVLTLPHPRMHERSFVLVPLAEICPEWIHPIHQQSVLQMLNLVNRDGVVLA